MADNESEPEVTQPPPAGGLGEVVRHILSALEQGNVTVIANDEVLDLRDAGLQGQVFDPVHLPEFDPGDPPSPP